MKKPSKFQIFAGLVLVLAFIGIVQHLYTGGGSMYSIEYNRQGDPSNYYSSLALLVFLFLGAFFALWYDKAKP